MHGLTLIYSPFFDRYHNYVFFNALISVVLDMRRDLLTGDEWGYVLSVLGTTISQLKTLVTNEEIYLDAMEDDDITVPVKKRIQDRFFIEQVCEIP